MNLSVSRIADRTEVLGPGIRAALWVRGCPLNCTGCISAEDIPFEGGTPWSVDDLAARFLSLPDEVTGITFSGGEPMAQAAGLAALTDRIRAVRDWSVMAYSGFTLTHLRRHGSDDQRALLSRLDVLVDGPYVRAQHAPLRWRGSRNQGLHYLTDRHRPDERDDFAGLEFAVDDGRISWIGVPPVAGFRSNFENAMRTQGVNFSVEGPDVS
ncbi:4Fe-4S single cluster domain-containing protein [Paractinoplanes lichenicola]|uniref:Radical SAM protein n=1 Tax=Paractinoplanes lichenicola TaxID=2802976 RepID=A0ABS1VDE5_9ACTN|nr:4Fe-4S single cluster domain-containing protein [Actinoplanes lichenicola]MBL7252713.1 radical SAM protein [Actinoplanes lichenicola]